MNHSYKETFLKDLKKLNKHIEYNIIQQFVFETLFNIKSIKEISNLKKIKSFKNYYRIKYKSFRIGISISGNDITFYRILHRKDIYKYFP
jgi:mRNA interferase RelE/StbE